MTQGVFDVLCGVETLEMKGTAFEFAAFVIATYKESGGKLTEITEVPKDIKGSIDVLEFVPNVVTLNLIGCKKVDGKFPGGFFCDQYLKETSLHFF